MDMWLGRVGNLVAQSAKVAIGNEFKSYKITFVGISNAVHFS